MQVLNAVKKQMGSGTVKKHGKKLIKKYIGYLAQKRVESGNIEAAENEEEEGEGDEEEEEEEAQDDEDENEEDYAPSDDESSKKRKKKKKRKRKKKADTDEDEDEDDDEEVDESPKKKKRRASKKRKKSPEEGGPPKKGLGAYFIFQGAMRAQVKEDNPELKLGEISKVLGEKWRGLDPDEKKVYVEKAAEDKKRYEREMEEWKENKPDEYNEWMESKQKNKKSRAKDPSKASKPKKPRKKAVRSNNSDDDDSDDGGDSDGAGRTARKKEEEEKELHWFDKVQAELKRKRKKANFSNEEQQEMVDIFLGKMNMAADEDQTLHRNGHPALIKLKMLAEVEMEVSKKPIQYMLLNRGLLRSFKEWLSPLEDGSVPNIKVRTSMYDLLNVLNVDEVHLENSDGLPKLLVTMWKREKGRNKTLLRKIIDKWTRSIHRLSTNYRKLAEAEEQRAREIIIRKKMSTDRELNAGPTVRARIPAPATFDYAIRPQAHLQPGGGGDDGDEAMEVSVRGESRKTKKEFSVKSRLTSRLNFIKKSALKKQVSLKK